MFYDRGCRRNGTEPVPLSPQAAYLVKRKSGGLLFLRRITPLPRRHAVYFCSGAHKDRLPTVAELYPEILKRDKKEDDEPSCSAAEALTRQESFINQNLAYQTLAMLTQPLRHGSLCNQGGFYNSATGQLVPLPIGAPKGCP